MLFHGLKLFLTSSSLIKSLNLAIVLLSAKPNTDLSNTISKNWQNRQPPPGTGNALPQTLKWKDIYKTYSIPQMNITK